MSRRRDGIADVWGPRTPQAGPNWPARVDQNTDEDPDRWVQSSCFVCSNGCGLDIGVKDDQARSDLDIFVPATIPYYCESRPPDADRAVLIGLNQRGAGR